MEKDLTKVSRREFDKLTKEEKEEAINKAPRTTFIKLIELHGKVNCMVDFINIIGELKLEDFGVQYNKLTKEFGGNPADFLNDYIILEMVNFYRLAYFEKEVKLPKVPEYWKKLRAFRHALPAHTDQKGEFETYGDLKEFVGILDEIGLDIILKDFNIYFLKCQKIFINQQKRDWEKRELEKRPICVRCKKRILGATYVVEDKDLEKDELIFHNTCFDKNYISDYLKEKRKFKKKKK